MSNPPPSQTKIFTIKVFYKTTMKFYRFVFLTIAVAGPAAQPAQSFKDKCRSNETSMMGVMQSTNQGVHPQDFSSQTTCHVIH